MATHHPSIAIRDNLVAGQGCTDCWQRPRLRWQWPRLRWQPQTNEHAFRLEQISRTRLGKPRSRLGKPRLQRTSTWRPQVNRCAGLAALLALLGCACRRVHSTRVIFRARWTPCMTAHVVFSRLRCSGTCESLPARVVFDGRLTVRSGNTCLLSGSVSPC